MRRLASRPASLHTRGHDGAARTPATGRLARVRRALRRRRRVLLGLALSALAVPVLLGLAPASTATVAVVVAARDLPAGARLSDSDLATVPVAASLAPQEAEADPRRLLGARTQGAVAAGSPITRGLLVGERGHRHAPGTNVIPVPVHAALVSDLTAGSRIALLITDPADPTGSTGRRIEGTVIEKPAPASGAGAVSLGSSDTPSTVLVAVEESDLIAIAHATATGALTVAVVD